MSGPQDDVVGKAYDARLMRRLLVYLRPHLLMAAVAFVAIVGGAIVPPLTGHLADLTDLRTALLLPAACYAVIAAYGVYARRPA